ncbi:MAG: YfiR family protein [Desulfobulbaceae bacterium]|nr:YfiR family protein [Desulfobulbaceae bacterium]
MVRKSLTHRPARLLLTALLSLLSGTISASGAPKALPETIASKQQLASAYLYNFLLFVHWPQDKTGADQSAITICIVGDDALGQHFAPVAGKAIKGSTRVLRVKNIRPPLQMTDLEDCAMLYVASPSPDYLSEILAQVKGRPILTVSDQPDFAAQGGMIALVEEGSKLRWRINQRVAGLVGLRFDAQLLRNAAEVVKTGPEGR